MRFFFSGGTLPTVPEGMIENADIMASFFNDVKKGQSNTRMRRLLKMKRKEKKGKK